MRVVLRVMVWWSVGGVAGCLGWWRVVWGGEGAGEVVVRERRPGVGNGDSWETRNVLGMFMWKEDSLLWLG